MFIFLDIHNSSAKKDCIYDKSNGLYKGYSSNGKLYIEYTYKNNKTIVRFNIITNHVQLGKKTVLKMI